MPFLRASAAPFRLAGALGAVIPAVLAGLRRRRRSAPVVIATGHGSRSQDAGIVAEECLDGRGDGAWARDRRPNSSRIEREAQQAMVFDTYRRFGIR